MLGSNPHRLPRPRIVAVMVFLLTAAVATTLIWRSEQYRLHVERAHVSDSAGEHAQALQRHLERALSVTYALAALVRQGNGTVRDFDAVATELLPFYPGAAALALAPGGIVQRIVPVAGNEKAIGHNLLKDPARDKEAFLARDTGQLTLAGPFNLVQGGLGAAGRLPVFLDNGSGTRSFWGFTAVVLHFPEALDPARLSQLVEQGLAYELWRIHPDSGQKQLIAASSPTALSAPVEHTLAVPNGTWTLSAAPAKGWGEPLGLALKAALALLFSLLLAALAKLLVELKAHQQRLEVLTAEVQAREADLNRAQSVARLGSWVFDVAPNELRWSVEACRILGLSQSPPSNREAFLERVHPEDRDAVERAWQAALNGASYDIEYRLAVGWVREHAEFEFNTDGMPQRGVGTVQDITERKQTEQALRDSEARLRAIIHAVPDILLVLDEDGRYVEILTTLPHLLYTEPATLKGRLLSEVMPAEVARQALHSIRQTLLTRQIQRFDYALSIRTVGKRYFEARTAPLEGPLMDKPAVVLLARDITQQRLTEESLRQAQKMEAVGQLTGGVAHDFNNLLAVILGNLELLAEAIDQPALASLVQRALEATERGALLIQRLLAFARRQALQTKPVDLNQLVVGLLELLRRTLGETIDMQMRLAADLALTAIDPNQLENALLNLVLNARDAMPQGGRLTLETATVWLDEDYAAGHPSVAPGRYVLLAVSDTGRGMPPTVVEHAFEPFFTTKEVGQGSGLGLSMVYGLVKQSGGHIHLYSEVGQGTTIKIYLPARPAETGVVLDPDAGKAPPYPGQGQTILVVEDEAPVRQLAVYMLRDLGYQTVEAETAATALAVLEATPAVALLFTDVVLPGGQSGVELAQEARQRRPDLQVLFTSGYTAAHLAQVSRDPQVGDLLNKPYRKAQLAAKLHALLGNGLTTGSL